MVKPLFGEISVKLGNSVKDLFPGPIPPGPLVEKKQDAIFVTHNNRRNKSIDLYIISGEKETGITIRIEVPSSKVKKEKEKRYKNTQMTKYNKCQQVN